MKILDSLKLVTRGFKHRLRESSRVTKAREQKQQAMYTESFMVASLRNQLDTIIHEMEESEKPIDSVVVHLAPEAIKYLSEAKSKVDCNVIPCATPGVYIIERQEAFF